MNRATAFSFALGTALAALSGCIATPATGDDTGEVSQELELTAPATSLSRSTAVQTSVVADKAALSSSALAVAPAIAAPKPVPPLWTFGYAKYCTPYDTYTSALAEMTIACTGTIGPESFVVEQDRLVRKFDECLVKVEKGESGITVKDIDDLLSLQEPQYEKEKHSLMMQESGFWPLRKCFTEPWLQWSKWLADRFAVTSNGSCPRWGRLSVDPQSDEPTIDNAERFAKLLPDEDKEHRLMISPEAARNLPIPKEQFYYVVKFAGGVADPQTKCETPELCGNACSNGLAGFYVDTKTVTVQLPGSNVALRPLTYKGPVIVGDPTWWNDPVVYAANTSPYLAADYYHPMSFYRALPGARFGHKNRRGDACSYFCWDSGFHMVGKLVADCVDQDDVNTCTISHCDPLPSTTPGPESGADSTGTGTGTP